MTTTQAPICVGCTHFRENEEGLKCDAFPDGIPQVILDSEFDHRDPYTGDNGIQFDSKTPEDETYADDLFDPPPDPDDDGA